MVFAPHGRGTGLLRGLGGDFGDAIREWASAPPRISLVAKTEGALRAGLWARNLPLTGTLTTAQAVSGSDARVVAQR